MGATVVRGGGDLQLQNASLLGRLMEVVMSKSPGKWSILEVRTFAFNWINLLRRLDPCYARPLERKWCPRRKFTRVTRPAKNGGRHQRRRSGKPSTSKTDVNVTGIKPVLDSKKRFQLTADEVGITKSQVFEISWEIRTRHSFWSYVRIYKTIFAQTYSRFQPEFQKFEFLRFLPHPQSTANLIVCRVQHNFNGSRPCIPSSDTRLWIYDFVTYSFGQRQNIIA